MTIPFHLHASLQTKFLWRIIIEVFTILYDCDPQEDFYASKYIEIL